MPWTKEGCVCKLSDETLGILERAERLDSYRETKTKRKHKLT